MNDTTSILDRWFPSRANDRAMLRSMQILIDQVATQNQTLKEIAERVSHQESSLVAVQALLADVVRAPLTHQLAEAQLWLHKISSESQNAFTHLDGAVSGARGEVRDLGGLVTSQNQILQQLTEHMGTNNAGAPDAFHGSLIQRIAEAQLWLEKISAENQSALAHLDGSIAGVRLWLEKISAETTNGLTHVDGRAVTQFNRLFNEALPQVNVQSHVAAALLLDARARGVDRRRWCASEIEHYRSAKMEDFDRTLAKIAADFPNVAQAWRERLDEIANAFAITKTGNAANAADMYSRMFKSFVEYHVHGRVLDVGCGVFGRPFYLSEYPAKLISGIEPLQMIETPDFECVRGITEYLPWRDDSFSTVINATSLDHVASLEKSLAEMFRVLRPGGTLLLWIGSTKGSPEFKPDSPQFVPADQFHLFHFDTAWFEPMLASRWEIIDRMEFATPSFDHVFYALRSTKGS